MEDLLEFLLNVFLGVLDGVFDFLDWPRFYACLVLSIAGASLNESLMPPSKQAHLVSALLVLIGLGTGVFWECTAR
jgi:hypothetical protein